MLCPSHPRQFGNLLRAAALGSLLLGSLLLGTLLLAPLARAQDPADAPASIPAGVAPASPHPGVSAKQAREAEDAYLEGAKHVEQKDLAAAERSFGQALKLNPGNPDYIRALALTRQQRVTELVQSAARTRSAGDNVRADALLAEARTLDPDNAIVQQHLNAPVMAPDQGRSLRAAEISASLSGPIRLKPAPGKQSFHRRAGAHDFFRAVYSAYGLKVAFDGSMTDDPSLRLDLDDVTFAEATHILGNMTHTFAVPLQPDTALIAKDTPENRESLIPQVEETIYLPGVPQEEMSELANVARSVFDIKQVTASASAGDLLVRSDVDTLRLLNATYDDMLDGGSDVLLDVHVYEVDRTHMVNLGAALPGSAGVFSVTAELQQIVNQNQSLINQLLAAGTIKLTGNYFADLAVEAGALLASGAVTLPQYSNLLGVFGALGSYTNAAGKVVGVPLAGLFLSSSSTFNLLLNSSDVRIVDAVTLRSSNRQDASFRAGTRYPVVTAQYSSGVSSALSSALSGININGTSANTLLNQYLGSSTVNVPQFQYEDLGITLKATPQIQHSGSISLKLDLKIEALGGGTIDSIPILNNRQLTSTINIPSGQTAMLASAISTNESKSLQGLPGLSELPGFQGTDQNTEKDSQELLITITPHIVRAPALHIASRPLSYPRAAGAGPQ